MKVTIHETGIKEENLTYVVIIVRHNKQWILARQRGQTTWEFAGGHIDENETSDEAAARELYEETGAEDYTLFPISIYSVTGESMPDSFGKLYLATVNKFGQLPAYEMEEICGFTEVPEELTYPMIYPALLSKVNEFAEQCNIQL
ncbi:hypothetical protein H70357_14680 [Paenibacillus sp. FSL H7-0357]|jgi:8-oxo-dGTP diphosphatase|uniref:NUDIX hydrolase n=1 Tax=unclassified Paenibacillus TaxID=185978 RepID=UPI0004F59547|nr:NUDIX domain-containing protein [Paenibacillus sp. FSL H7-0357]AIQ17765.1 hypothetical protein H70357_14680 [Paenibacillus sp. FSL H7-0357]